MESDATMSTLDGSDSERRFSRLPFCPAQFVKPTSIDNFGDDAQSKLGIVDKNDDQLAANVRLWRK
jgi:hypothetical protein